MPSVTLLRHTELPRKQQNSWFLPPCFPGALVPGYVQDILPVAALPLLLGWNGFKHRTGQEHSENSSKSNPLLSSSFTEPCLPPYPLNLPLASVQLDCCDLNFECTPKAHVLKAWFLAWCCWEMRGTFRRRGQMRDL